MDLKPYILLISNNQDLNEKQSEEVFEIILSGHAKPIQIAGILMGLKFKGETIEEITGAAKVLRNHAVKINAPINAIDTCGTGGDNSSTLNISTASSFIIAAADIPVAKHGNKAVSSKSGSADVLQEMGINIFCTATMMEESLNKNNIAFFMAPLFHQAMKHVALIRQELGTRTIFNLLGPLLNPAQVQRQIIGVYDKNLLEPFAQVLKNLGSQHVWVVHGRDGLDEITTTTITDVVEVKEGKISQFEINPEQYNLKSTSLADLKGGDATQNAQAVISLLKGEKGPFRDIVCLNAAAAMIIAGKTDDLNEGIQLAEKVIDQKLAYNKWQDFMKATKMDTAHVA